MRCCNTLIARACIGTFLFQPFYGVVKNFVGLFVLHGRIVFRPKAAIINLAINFCTQKWYPVLKSCSFPVIPSSLNIYLGGNISIVYSVTQGEDVTFITIDS